MTENAEKRLKDWIVKNYDPQMYKDRWKWDDKHHYDKSEIAYELAGIINFKLKEPELSVGEKAGIIINNFLESANLENVDDNEVCDIYYNLIHDKQEELGVSSKEATDIAAFGARRYLRERWKKPQGEKEK